MSNVTDDQEKPAEHENPGVIHSVDGIEECDNQLPNWWLYTLFGTIAFGMLYWYGYEIGHFADGPLAQYQTEMDRVASEELAKSGPITAESLVLVSRDTAKVAQGRALFVATCAPCHREDAGGNVGPNLTDDYWIHGGAPDKIFATISDGVKEKGMPSWRSQLGLARVQSVTAYLLTIRHTNVSGGKPPQGNQELTLNTP